MLVLLTLVGCMNVHDRMWGGGGTRYATGVAATGLDDTAGDTGGGNSGGGTAPDITAIEGSIEDMGDNIGLLTGSLSYTDSQDDLVGGTLFNTLQRSSVENHPLTIVASSDEVSSDEEGAWISGEGTIDFQIWTQAIDWGVTSTLQDEAGHSSADEEWVAYVAS